jgi:hypothetical protein
MKCAAFHAPVCMKVNAELRYIQVTCTDFFSHWAINVGSMDKNYLSPHEVWHLMG